MKNVFLDFQITEITHPQHGLCYFWSIKANQKVCRGLIKHLSNEYGGDYFHFNPKDRDAIYYDMMFKDREEALKDLRSGVKLLQSSYKKMGFNIDTINLDEMN